MLRTYVFTFLALSFTATCASAEELSFSKAEHYLGSIRSVQAQQADIDAWSAQQQALQSLNIPQLSLTVAGLAYHKHLTFEPPILPQPAVKPFRLAANSQIFSLPCKAFYNYPALRV